MKKRIIGAILTGTLVVGLIPAAASAGKPLDVDCDLLAATNEGINDFLDGEGVQFANVGDLAQTAIRDAAVFNQLNVLVELFSGGEISFDSATQAASTIAKCGLAPQIIDHIRD